MAVHVDVAILGLQRRHWRRSSDFDTRRFLDGTRLVAYIVHNASVVHGHQVDGFARLHTDHGPYGACITNLASVLTDNGKVTVGEEAIDVLHPRLHRKSLVLIGHLVHLDSQSGQYPRIVFLVQCSHAETAFGGMNACTVQQVVAQHAQRQPSCKVYMERFGYEIIGSYLVVHRSRIFSF